MPVKSQADTMLSSHLDSIWTDNMPSMAHFDDEHFDMQFLTSDPALSLFPNYEGIDNITMDFSEIITQPSSPKLQIRHHDCMWSGTCVDKSHPSKRKGLNQCSAQSQQSQLQQQQHTESSSKSTLELSNVAVKVITQKNIMTPNVMKTIMNKNNSNNNSISNSKIATNQRSLLINNNNNRVNTNTAPLTNKIQNTSKSIELNSRHQSCEFDSIMNASIANLRPDTPLSLGDDVPEFKHNIDLTPCPSSNRMKFNDPNSIKIINALAEHLEETSNSLNDPINPFMNGFRANKSTPTDLNEILTDITFLSDYEDLGDDSSIIDMDDDDQMDENDYKNSLMSQASTSSSTSSGMISRNTINHHEFISDHSYTRPKGSHYDPIALGVQTPSDSEEEIDVDTIIEKNLPTNPSARDRRALQTTVAHKIARSKHAANQRRRVSDDDSISSSTSTLSSKGSTPIKYGSQTPARYVSSLSSSSRKRHAAGHSKDGNNNVHDNHKRYRTTHNKKQKLNARNNHHKQIDQEELETIEKRNLHNNMERQRRIGLKNLFEELKCHIPALKDKERAPKVNILREAASYCTKLRRDEEQYAELLKKHNRLMTRVKNLKASIAAQQRRNY
ncbi:hypothetical protein PVAND_014108 [Polypedilum vanderplanki]|uniref:BHLH domain-containing protein n=1 Tax=Polypedilum vanderplanki TaxID=319348 RepID=A0A9J6CRC5_POLVA|nr:hypothetical protein PVAND_014108 [Polypedilum vanderplanki]